ncbi:acyl-CoA dehydrogenase family protein [Laspinema olomoucense]|uniref:acyl-CoA dehydrogenase family protein n=1 Tax=Laspinema olomoucense TaxID=3231600 RepID=UPI0021BB300F|nr:MULTISPECIES: acyl-CoA dehydrogenase family protein [unclassified Laspinema]MCT7970543.1 acyl-CoA/acyl-ACP dehydrogenase [Laspinema sp. D3d]MCT7989592.1 acyl-CoA/acyl-ACP dehydrogenase [Laspinema sp. D3a]
MNSQQTLLAVAESYLQDVVAPNAAILDQDPDALKTALKGLGSRHLLGLKLPEPWGTVDPQTAWEIQEAIARYSGALGFLQTQHQSAGSAISRSHNQALKAEYLPHLATGKRLLGIGFSHLRRQGNPLVKALPIPGGFLLSGTVPWVTGFGIFHEVVLGAELPDHRAVYGIIPLVNCQKSGGQITWNAPMSLAAMQSTQTVSGILEQWFLPEEKLLFMQPARWIHESDRKTVLNNTCLLLGCARAGLDIIAAIAQKKPLPGIAAAFNALDRQVITCRQNIQQLMFHQSQEELDTWYSQALLLRVQAIDLAYKTAQGAITVSSGASNLGESQAGRVYREALVFGVSGQTSAVMEATLAQLMRSP